MAEEARIHISSHDEYEPEILTQSQATPPGADRGSGDERDDGDNGVTEAKQMEMVRVDMAKKIYAKIRFRPTRGQRLRRRRLGWRIPG